MAEDDQKISLKSLGVVLLVIVVFFIIILAVVMRYFPTIKPVTDIKIDDLRDVISSGEQKLEFDFDNVIIYLKFFCSDEYEVKKPKIEEVSNPGGSLNGEAYKNKYYKITIEKEDGELTKSDIIGNKNNLIRFKVTDEFKKNKNVVLAYYKSDGWITKVTSDEGNNVYEAGFEGPGIYAIVGYKKT